MIALIKNAYWLAYEGMPMHDLRKARMFSVMLDESTDKGGKKNLLVYVRYPEKGRFVTKFWTVVEVERGDGRAERLLRMLVNHFKLMDVPIAKLAAYASDGASVVSSKRAGLAGLIAKGPAPLWTGAIPRKLRPGPG